MRKTCTCLLVLCFLSVASPAQITAKFFGMHINHREEHGWPAVHIGTYRLWDSQTNWFQISKQKDKYDWSVLDRRLKDAQEHGADVLYTFGKTPRWASSRPDDQSECGDTPGSCGPPADLKEDGTGPDQYWKDFVTAIVKHADGRIQYWEIWNEPFNAMYWKGTFPQMVRMAKDAQEIIKNLDPSATVLTPCGGLRNEKAKAWMQQYLAAGGGQYADGISFHAYIRVPENIDGFLHDFRKLLEQYGQASKPIFDTEGSWNPNGEPEDPSADIARLYILQAAERVSLVVWYSWDNRKLGTLWTPEAGTLPAAKSYDQLQDWLIGATFDHPCEDKNNVWSCAFHKDGGQASIVWVATPGASANYKVPEGYVSQRDLTGNTSPLKGGTTTISNRPILLEQGHK